MRRPIRDNATAGRRMGRRALLLGTVQLGVVGLLGWRMQSMQVKQAEDFRLLAEENRINLRLLPPERGIVFDINGVELAQNEQNYRIVLRREDAGDVDMVLARLARLMPIDPAVLERTKQEALARPSFTPVAVMDRVSWEDISKVTVNAPALPGITAEVGLSRHYPLGANTAHVVGYVGPVSDYDLGRIEDPDPVLSIPRFQIGKTGVEAKLEELLRGSAGNQQVEVNALGRVMRELDRRPGDPGADVQLAVDSRLQTYVEARMAGQSASAVVIDLKNGDLRAIASTPSFDPNLFVRGISTTSWNGLNTDAFRPLASKAVQDAYPPGSTFKMVTLLAAMENGDVDPEETVYCPGYSDIAGNRFHCWRRGGHGNINLHESLKQSCDCYYYEICQRVGIDRIAEMARKLGLGIKHDIPMSAVSSGLTPNKDWKLRNRGEDWRIGDTVNASIGQGYVLASPLQLAVMIARIATGKEISPRLVHRINDEVQPSGMGADLGLNENILRRVRQSMYDVVNHQRGTAYSKRFNADGMRMAGKTGTAQVRRIDRTNGVTANEDMPWEFRDHALWVNFAPFDEPRFAVAVVVEHGGGGSTTAAPIGRDITLQALYEGDPPLEVYPGAAHADILAQQERIRTYISDGTRVSDRT